MYKILCVGQEWRGSNASGLFYAFSRIGCIINIVNERTYVSTTSSHVLGKVVQQLFRPLQVTELNTHLLTITDVFQPDIVLVFKGAFVTPQTILAWKKKSIPVVNFFPDVSFTAHGKYIPKCVPHYDFIFSTKTFASADLLRNFNYPKDKVHFIAHGFDPMIHRKLDDPAKSFHCNASFIGNYSPHKEKYLAALKAKLPDLDLKIWGGHWWLSKMPILKSCIQGIGIQGDLYALALNQSDINIALLSERVQGASMGDQITSRTFHIPGSGGFMLHQRTEEVAQYFKEDEEIACFSSEDELIEKVTHYTNHPDERNRICENGFKRAVKDHSLDMRAREIIMVLKQKFILK